MKNWSGIIDWSPAKVFFPETKEEIIQIIHEANRQNRNVRTIGSGHSFTPLSKTDDFLVSLDKFQGITAVDKTKNQVKVRAGTKISLLNRLLDKVGLALENMGDIDVQSIAGAISTGTHGTGVQFGNVSTQVKCIEFINGLGETVTCSETFKPDVFKAAQVSLGALGIITEIILQCVPNYSLQLKVDKKRLCDVLENYQELNKTNRNFEFYWFPHTQYVMTKALNITNSPTDKSSYKDYIQEMVLENYLFKGICELSHYVPSLTRPLSNLCANTIGQHQKTRKSFNVFSTERLVRFNEMEYNVPIECYREVKSEVTRWINKHNYDILFPIENRFVKGDDIYLSPAYQRDSAYIAFHAYHKMAFGNYFKNIEAILKAYNGRPHWGKIHTLGKKEIAALYPKFEEFCRIRARHDPQGRFLSPYLKSLLV